MTEQEMDALLELCAWDARTGNASDHYFRVFESRRTVTDQYTLEVVRSMMTRVTVLHA